MVSEIDWRSLDEDEYRQLVTNLEAECISEERVGYVTCNDGNTYPCIRINERLFRKLIQAGEIDVTSRINTKTAGAHFYVEMQFNWESIERQLTLLYNGWRDRNWLELLCATKKVAMTTHDFRVSVPPHIIIVVDGLNVDRLWLTLVTTSMFRPPTDFPFQKNEG